MQDHQAADQLCILVKNRIQEIARGIREGAYPNRSQMSYICPHTGIITVRVVDSNSDVIGNIINAVMDVFPRKHAASDKGATQPFVCYKTTWEHVAIAIYCEKVNPQDVVFTIQPAL